MVHLSGDVVDTTAKPSGRRSNHFTYRFQDRKGNPVDEELEENRCYLCGNRDTEVDTEKCQEEEKDREDGQEAEDVGDHGKGSQEDLASCIVCRKLFL